MILWPAGLAVAVVWNVFRDTAIDYRLVMAGAVLPDVIDAPLGGARVMHTLVASVLLLAGVMVATRGRRRARRRWLAVPIGTFIHLVLDGVWTQTSTFWWPAFGWGLHHGLPAGERALALVVVQEVIGAGALVWFWHRFGLAGHEVRRTFLRTGRLPRDLVG